MYRLEIPKRLVFYCAKCDRNPEETPDAHAATYGCPREKFLFVTVPDLRRVPANTFRAS